MAQVRAFDNYGGTLMRTATKFLATLLVGSFMSGPVFAADSFRFAWSHYIGWEPLACADSMGIFK